MAVAKARWAREHDKAAGRYEDYQQAKARGQRPRGRPAVPPEKHHKVRQARQDYQAEKAAAEAATNTDQDADETGTGTDDSNSGQAYRANLSDPDSRLLKTREGWIQGYNCQTSTSDDGFTRHRPGDPGR